MRSSASGSAATKSVHTRSTVAAASKVPGQACPDSLDGPPPPTSLTDGGRSGVPAMSPRLAPPAEGTERRLAVIDMGSNTFRLVVFRYRPAGPFQLVDEIRDAVRLSGGAGPEGLHPEALERAAHTTRLYAAFCAASEVDTVAAVATSAVRDAANRDEALAALSAEGALEVRVLSAEEEAWYGYLGAVNSTTLGDGHVLDLGGGSVQVSQVLGRSLGPGGVATPGRGAHDRGVPPRRAGRARPDQGAAAPRGALPGRRAVARRRRRPHGRRGRHDPHPGEHAPAPHPLPAGRAARVHPHPPRDRGPGRRHGRAAGERAQPPRRPQARPRRHHARGRGRDLDDPRPGGRGGDRDLRPGPARGRLLRAAPLPRRPAPGGRRAAPERDEPGRDVPLRHPPRHARHRAGPGGLRRARPPGPAAAGPSRARAAVGGRDAPRRGRAGGLQRPPQARLLPGAQRRAAGLPRTRSWP